MENWLVWTDDHTFRTKNFEFSCSTTAYSGKTSGTTVVLLKTRKMLHEYCQLLMELNARRIFEIGFFQGGMPLFLAETAAPDKIVAIDKRAVSSEMEETFSRIEPGERIRLYGGVDQGDIVAGKRILEREFGEESLDLIIDDCSHTYRLTKTCFEEYFGYLRPGGKYVIEDWGWLHWPGHPWQTSDNHFYGQEPLSKLIFELIMLHASNSAMVARIDIRAPALAVITRGPGLPAKDRIDLDRSYLTCGRTLLLPRGATSLELLKMHAQMRFKRLSRKLKARTQK